MNSFSIFFNLTLYEFIILIILLYSYFNFGLAVIAALSTSKLKPNKRTFSKNLPPLTIIIPSRNESTVIKRCLESILLQKYPKLNVHVAINNSIEEQIKQMISITKEFPNYFSFADYGKMDDNWINGKAWVLNEVLLNFSNMNEYILILDADINFTSQYSLATIMHKYITKKTYSLISILPKFRFNSLTERLIFYMIPPTLNLAGFFNNLLYRGLNPNFSNILGAFLLFKKSELDQINKNSKKNGLEILKTCPFTSDIGMGRYFIHNKKRINTFFGGKLIQIENFSTAKKARIGMKRFGTGTFAVLPKRYKILIIHLILMRLTPYILLFVIFILFIFRIYLNPLIFYATLIGVVISLISEYYILYLCEMKGVLPFLLTPVKFFFMLWAFLSCTNKRANNYVSIFNQEIRE